MGNVPVQFRTRKPRKILKHAKRKEILENKFEDLDEKPIDTQHLLISTLLPCAVKAFIEECEREVTALCGRRYERGSVNSRWGTQKGSIVLANQRIAIEKPRVRKKTGDEVQLQTYEDFQDPRLFDQAVFTEGLKRVSQRDYKKGVAKIANSFGLQKSTVSKCWINATAKKLEELQERDHRTRSCKRRSEVRARYFSSGHRKQFVVPRVDKRSGATRTSVVRSTFHRRRRIRVEQSAQRKVSMQ